MRPSLPPMINKVGVSPDAGTTPVVTTGLPGTRRSNSVIAALGQLLFALSFAELTVRYPLASPTGWTALLRRSAPPAAPSERRPSGWTATRRGCWPSAATAPCWSRPGATPR